MAEADPLEALFEELAAQVAGEDHDGALRTSNESKFRRIGAHW